MLLERATNFPISLLPTSIFGTEQREEEMGKYLAKATYKMIDNSCTFLQPNLPTDLWVTKFYPFCCCF
jgi:hypothetical protein